MQEGARLRPPAAERKSVRRFVWQNRKREKRHTERRNRERDSVWPPVVSLNCRQRQSAEGIKVRLQACTGSFVFIAQRHWRDRHFCVIARGWKVRQCPCTTGENPLYIPPRHGNLNERAPDRDTVKPSCVPVTLTL